MPAPGAAVLHPFTHTPTPTTPQPGAPPQTPKRHTLLGAAVVVRLLGLLLRSGMDREAAARAETALMQYTVGAALWTASGRRRGLSQQDGGERLRTRFAGLPTERFPHLVDLAPELASVQDGVHQYEHGLDALLDGLLPAT